MLSKLYLKNFRNQSELKLKFAEGVTVLLGENGCGKTNILESIYFLSLLRSFRSAKPKDFVKLGESEFLLMAELLDSESGEKEILKITQNSDGNSRKLAINNQNIAKSSEFIKRFRAVIFAPEDRAIVASSASFRRRYFDILISLESSEYLNALKNYNNALINRNAILKKSISLNSIGKILYPFELIMAESAVVIMNYRRKYSEIIGTKVAELWGSENQFSLEYAPKINADNEEDFLRIFAENYEKDLARTYTSSGVHLDEFDFLLNGKLLRTFGSSGQIRLTSLFLRMAEFELSCEQDKAVIALIDDVTGELDEINYNKFLNMLKNAEQSIFTFAKLIDSEFFKDAKVYHFPFTGE
ncbi:MAG: DNA replication/repair protein RecF [Lentisphaeria bacterium]|nr:DNA replication/repair protein RecF [Lentisphaeria bacterium]